MNDRFEERRVIDHEASFVAVSGKEFRIYCEDLEEFPIRVMTKGFCMALREAYDCRMKEARELRAAAQNS